MCKPNGNNQLEIAKIMKKQNYSHKTIRILLRIYAQRTLTLDYYELIKNK